MIYVHPAFRFPYRVDVATLFSTFRRNTDIHSDEGDAMHLQKLRHGAKDQEQNK
jgi:hypothetical protein